MASLGMRLLEPDFGVISRQSMTEDPIFQAFCVLLANDKTQKIWRNLIDYQMYPDPQIFMSIESFMDTVADAEPGKQIDYEQIRSYLTKEQVDFQGACSVKSRMFEMCNDLLDLHVCYVHAATNAKVFEMYDRLIDRFYGRFRDMQFEQFISSNLIDGFDGGRMWPSYEHVKQNNTLNLDLWREHQKAIASDISATKNSAGVGALLGSLENDFEAYSLPCGSSGEPLGTTTAHSHQPRLSRMILTQRHTAIERRNIVISDMRVMKNERLKRNNIDNVNQLGDQGRQFVHDSIVQWIHAIQEQWKDRLFEENSFEDADEEEPSNWDGVDKKVEDLNSMAGPIPNGREEFLDGIVIPEGFVNVAGGSAGYI